MRHFCFAKNIIKILQKVLTSWLKSDNIIDSEQPLKTVTERKIQNMKNYKITLKAKDGFKVSLGHERTTLRPMRLLRDGTNIVMCAYDMSYKDFLENLEDNEMFGYYEVFKTIKGNKFIYARDNEIDEDYLIKVGE